MEKNIQDTKELLLRHVQMYPGMEVQDCIKLLYQNEWGAEHSMEDEASFVQALQKELATPGLYTAAPPQPSPIGNGLYRVHLSAMEDGPKAATLARLVKLAARRHKGEEAAYRDKLALLRAMITAGDLPYALGEAALVDETIAAGCPAVHHSARFAALYQPHYRLLDTASALYLPVFAAADKALAQTSHALFCIDGMCASGKSSLAQLMQEVYGCGLVLADDFFLQPNQRSEERLAEPGGNIDYERLAVVAAQAADDRAFRYQVYDCGIQQLADWREVPAGPLTVLEGAYCLNPKVGAKSDVRVFLSVDAKEQMRRILHRNGPVMAARFEEEWIPMENRYFAAYGVRESCDVIINTTNLA